MHPESGFPLDDHRPLEPSVFDHELEEEIKEILKIGGTHKAAISIRQGSKAIPTVWTDHQIKTITKSGTPESPEHTVTNDGTDLFHIGSITKVLVATAVVIAIEIKATENKPNNLYSEFSNIQEEPLSTLYNKRNEVMMGALPGNPTLYELIVHYKSLPASNHRLIAFDGTPIMTLAELLDDVLRPISHQQDAGHVDANKTGSGYSNTNYSAIAMAINTLWGDDLNTFMNDTLFKPLKMMSTSIGFPTERAAENYGWVVDSKGRSVQISRPEYRPDGAEAGALGAYSTAHDLDIFFKFIIDSFHDHQVLPGFDVDVAGILLQMNYEVTESLQHSPFGLYTNLRASDIGAMSTNRLQFPTQIFSTYPVLPSPLGQDFLVFYMAGSAIGCTCATAFFPWENPFAVVVLTDTSGPVDTADHILRLILRKLACLSNPDQVRTNSPQPRNVEDMVEKAMTEACKRWRQIEEKDTNYVVNQASRNSKDLDVVGVYKGDGFSQQLKVVKADDGKIYITVCGSSASSKPFELVWIDDFSVKVCVPPHLSIDCLGTADWSNLVFRVLAGQDRLVMKLIRKTVSGKDHFSRQPA